MATSPNTFRAAVRKNEIERIRGILAAAANPAELAREGFSTACSGGHAEIVQLLLDAGLDVQGTNSLGNTPLFEALDSKQFIKLLVERGADVNTRNLWQKTPLHMAAANHSGAVQLLIDLGAEIEAQDNEGCTPLHVACRLAIKNSVKALLKNGANPNSVCEAGTPLTIAAHGPEKSRLAIVQELLAAAADVNLPNPRSNMTPLLVAAAHGATIEVLQVLLDAGADLSAAHVGRNALQLAEEEGNYAQAELLRSKGLC